MPAEQIPSLPLVPPQAARRRPTRTLHLGAAIDCPRSPAATWPGASLPEGATPQGSVGVGAPADSAVELARLAERGGLDFVTLGGSGPPGPIGAPDDVARATDRIGVLAVAPAEAGAGTAADIAVLDEVSRGRAGWVVVAPATASATPPGGRTGTSPGPEARSAAAAGPRTADRSDPGTTAGVPGPTMTATSVEAAGAAAVRTWQDMREAGKSARDSRPVLVLDATEPAARGAVARVADIALVRAVRPEDADRVGAELRALAARAGRDPERLLVLADLAVDLGGGELGREPGAVPAPVAGGAAGPLFRGGPVDLAELVARWHASGAVDGFHIRPVEPARDLERFVNGTVALLQHRGLFRTFHPGATLREHLGLHRPPRGPAASATSPNPYPPAKAYGRLGL